MLQGYRSGAFEAEATRASSLAALASTRGLRDDALLLLETCGGGDSVRIHKGRACARPILFRPIFWPANTLAVPPTCFLPDATGVFAGHGSAFFASEGFAKFWRVGDCVVHPIFWDGVRIGQNDRAHQLGTILRAPGVSERQEETLASGPSVVSLVVNRLARHFQLVFERHECQANSAVVSGVFAEREFTVLLDARFWNFLAVLIDDALAAGFIGFCIGVSPPVAQVSLGIELATLVVETMNDFVSDNHSDCAVVHRVVFRGFEVR